MYDYTKFICICVHAQGVSCHFAERVKIVAEAVVKDFNKHYPVGEVFKSPLHFVKGFTEKDYNKGLHSQGFYEVNIVLHGEAAHKIGLQTLTVKAGDTFIIPPDVKHGYAGGKGFDVYHILISPKYLEKHAVELGLLPAFSLLFRIDPILREKNLAGLNFTLTPEELAELKPTLERLAKHTRLTGAANAILAGAEALIAITKLCRIYEKRGLTHSATEMDDGAFLSSVAYVYENFADNINVETLARRARMSRTAYITKFKRVTGLPPAALQRQYRVSVAKQLLTDTPLTQTEIAQRVGFYDTSHFVRVFKAELGITPLAYRKSCAQG